MSSAYGSVARVLAGWSPLTLLLMAAVLSCLPACKGEDGGSPGQGDGGTSAPGQRDGGDQKDGAAPADAGNENPGDGASTSQSDAAPLDVDATGTDAAVGGGTVPTFVAVGYAGLRVVSYDLGVTWVHRQTLSNVAEDDVDNLRAVTFANGLFVATGHRIFTSPDGRHWTPREHPLAPDENGEGGQWLGGVAFGNGRFVAAGGFGYTLYSLDGVTWAQIGDRGDDDMRRLAFGNGIFMGVTGSNEWWSSADGTDWAFDRSGRNWQDFPIQYCDGMFHDAACGDGAAGAGVRVFGGEWDSGLIYRMPENADLSAAIPVDVGYVGGINGIAFGYTHGE